MAVGLELERAVELVYLISRGSRSRGQREKGVTYVRADDGGSVHFV
jgi:hypothetical protein